MKTVAESWAEFERMASAPKWMPIQKKHMRRGFYAGVLSMLCDIVEMGTDGVSAEEATAHLHRVKAECRDFTDRVVRGEA